MIMYSFYSYILLYIGIWLNIDVKKLEIFSQKNASHKVNKHIACYIILHIIYVYTYNYIIMPVFCYRNTWRAQLYTYNYVLRTYIYVFVIFVDHQIVIISTRLSLPESLPILFRFGYYRIPKYFSFFISFIYYIIYMSWKNFEKYNLHVKYTYTYIHTYRWKLF